MKGSLKYLVPILGISTEMLPVFSYEWHFEDTILYDVIYQLIVLLKPSL